ncbi:MAG: hypothetical protein H7Y03_02260 [Chitinophagaceae bacterium]|nr:hypothetical protein [Chitinophagaceae bacterium]
MKNNMLIRLLITSLPLLFLSTCVSTKTGAENSAAIHDSKNRLVITDIGKEYIPDGKNVVVAQNNYDKGGTTSIRNIDREHLAWKEDGYFQRNRDIGQVFTPEKDVELQAIVLRTGPTDKAVLENTPGAKMFVQFYQLSGNPTINDNGTPLGTNAKHGFSSNHRCDDYIEGVEYKTLQVVKGGVFPKMPITFKGDSAVNSDEGRLRFMRWKIAGPPLAFQQNHRYAFIIGFEEPGNGFGFTLANANTAGFNYPPSITDENDNYKGGWSIRREGDGQVLLQTFPGNSPPQKQSDRARLYQQSLFDSKLNRWKAAPYTDGYPDVDTYRDLQFFIEGTYK